MASPRDDSFLFIEASLSFARFVDDTMHTQAAGASLTHALLYAKLEMPGGRVCRGKNASVRIHSAPCPRCDSCIAEPPTLRSGETTTETVRNQGRVACRAIATVAACARRLWVATAGRSVVWVATLNQFRRGLARSNANRLAHADFAATCSGARHLPFDEWHPTDSGMRVRSPRC